MLKIKGTEYKTVSDAAAWFGVSVKSVREWIGKKIISTPPQKSFGLKDVDIFPDEYLENASKQLDQYRAKKRQKRKVK